MFITKLGHYPSVLAIPSLRLCDVEVRFASNTVMFGLQHYTTHCYNAPVTVQRVTEEPPKPVCPVGDIFKPQIRPQRLFWGKIIMLNGALFICTVKQ